jgi:hypothetical protein
VSGPHDFAVCADIVRPRTTSAPRHQHIHRIPASRSVTIGQNALYRGGMTKHNHVFPKNESEMFSQKDWTGDSALNAKANFVFSRMRFFGLCTIEGGAMASILA